MEKRMKKLKIVLASVLMMTCMLAYVIFVNAASPQVNITTSTDESGNVYNIDGGGGVAVFITFADPSGIVGGGYTVLINGTSVYEIDFDNDTANPVSSGFDIAGVQYDPANKQFQFAFGPASAGDYVISLGALTGADTGAAEIHYQKDGSLTVDAITYSPKTITATVSEPETEPEPETETEPETESQPETEACRHEHTHKVNESAADCGRDGYTGDTVCDDCGETVSAGTVIPATGAHNFSNGSCTVCGAKDPNYVAPTMTGIEVSYKGNPNKTVGETIVGSDIEVLAVYSDGRKEAIGGWGCALVGVGLVAGDHNVEVVYGSYKGYFTVHVTEAAEPVTAEPETPEQETPSEPGPADDETTTAAEEPGDDYLTVFSPFGGENLYIATEWSDDIKKPDGYETQTVNYKGYDVKALKNDKGITLFYLTDSEGANGDFYIYDADSSKFSYLITIPSNTYGYYILSFPDDMDVSKMAKMVITLDPENGRSVVGYHLSKDKEESGTVCLVYAMDEEGNKGYYRFDTANLSFVRYYEDASAEPIVETVEVIKEVEKIVNVPGETVYVDNGSSADPATRTKYNDLVNKYNHDILVRFYVIIALIALAVILFAFVLILALKLKKLYSEYDFIDDEEEDDDGTDEPDDDDEGEDDEEEDDEEEDDEEAEDEDFRVDLSGINDDEE